jgi:hypothetical protein
MPNGRSGGFLLETATLKQLIKDSSQVESVAIVVDGGPPLRPATASDLAPLIDGVKAERVGVEQQDGTSYVIHLSNEPILWIFVKSDSPLLVPLRQHHALWQAANPSWHGWIAF